MPFKKGGIEFGGDYFRPSDSSSGFFPPAGAGFFAINFRPLQIFRLMQFRPSSSPQPTTGKP